LRYESPHFGYSIFGTKRRFTFLFYTTACEFWDVAEQGGVPSWTFQIILASPPLPQSSPHLSSFPSLSPHRIYPPLFTSVLTKSFVISSLQSSPHFLSFLHLSPHHIFRPFLISVLTTSSLLSSVLTTSPSFPQSSQHLPAFPHLSPHHILLLFSALTTAFLLSSVLRRS
jgi:hypothetical protein